MRRRVLTTTKVLSVALAMLPACTKPDVHPDPGPTLPSASAVATPSASAADPKVVALSDELAAMNRDDALKQLDHFRPLCDAAGYPLVGNLQRKAPGLTPSEVCAEVRKKQTR
jgi:hypothetical protein